MFRRILVAIDNSDAARSAFVFVTDWARQFDAKVWFIVLTGESNCRRSELVTDVPHRGRQLANCFMVSGATRGARNHRLVWAIDDAAKVHRADLIILGLDPRRMARQHFTKGVHELLTSATDTPILVAPPQGAPIRVDAPTRDLSPIPLDARREPAAVDLVLASA